MRIFKPLICLVLCISVLLSLASCSIFFPHLAAGPDTTYDKVHDEKWIETADEMRQIVSLLRSHGSEIDPIPFFDCEEYGIDIKFSVHVRRSLLKEIDEDEDIFDRKMDNLFILSYVFFEDVTAEDVENADACVYN